MRDYIYGLIEIIIKVLVFGGDVVFMDFYYYWDR